MISDSGFLTEATFEIHTQADGSNIGGVPPIRYGMVQSPPGFPAGALFYIGGSTVKGGYADWLAGTLRPLCQNTGSLRLSFDLYVDGNSLVNAQALEFDTILCIGGFNYNLSTQLDYARGGLIQVGTPNSGWSDTPYTVGKLAPNVKHAYQVDYAFDIAAKTCRVISLTLDGIAYPMAAPAIPAVEKGWLDGAVFQVQQDLTSAGGEFSMLLDNAQYEWR